MATRNGDQTSPAVAALAARLLAMSDLKLDAWLGRRASAVRRDIRTLCGSLVGQASGSHLEPYSDRHDGSEVGDFQTYVRRAGPSSRSK